jgi:predicted CxxxxCH...CXXCH cytochrome family protein
MSKLVVGSALVFLAVLFVGCSELKKDLPPSGGTFKVHPGGWTDSTSSDFHGKAVMRSSWDVAQCKTCHGSRYDGGTANVSCLTCHNAPAGPENCSTCHGSPASPAPPRDLAGNTATTNRGVGAHQMHVLGGSISAGISCANCHNVPPTVYTSGHIDSPLPAEVPMNGFLANVITNEPSTADYDSILALFTPTPTLDPATMTCSNTYCHGHFKNGNVTNIVTWNNVGGGEAACGTCHGDVSQPTLAQRALPRTSAQSGTHPNNLNCANCHGDVVNASLQFVDRSKHINGRLNVFGQERDF